MQNSFFYDTVNGKPASRPPVWFMRQAGRVLPSYNKLKEQYSFWDLMKDPKLAAEVTLLPVYDLGVDAAILFSDILVIPYAMGMGLEFTDKGPVFENPLKNTDKPMDQLHPDPAKLNYIYQTIKEIVRTRPENTPLIGFCGAPFTVLCYMIQGLSSHHEFPDAINFIYKNKETAKKLVEVITELSIEYATQQINHGIDTFQLFESHAGLIPNELYNEMFLPSVSKICSAVRDRNIPFIFFPKGIGSGISQITPEHCDYLSIDWLTSIDQARKMTHKDIGLQGNLDPRLLMTSPEILQTELEKYIDFGAKNQNWIFNLGHGVLAGTSFENTKFAVDWIKKADWKRN